MAMLRAGAQLGEIKVVRVIGSGNVATVYEALYDGARRALKVVDLSVAPSSTIRARVVQEAEAIARIEHVNVVRWYDSGIDDARIWIVLELVEGKNLREVLAEAGGKLTIERAVTIVRHAAEGLAAVHRKGIVHRDVKPENILVLPDDTAKVADFGSAKLPGWGVKTTNTLGLSSMAYMPPERWKGAEPDLRGDVYSLGLILYEAITGKNPVVPEPSDVRTMLERHLGYEPPPLASLIPEFPGDLSDLVQRALAKDPACRPTMREFADALEVVLDRLLVWRRRAAGSLPLPNQDAALAMTAPMPVVSEPVPAVVSGVRTGRGGTIPMRAVPSSGVHDTERTVRPVFEACEEPRDTDRAASPPPMPSVDPASAPSTKRTPSRPPPAPQAAPPPDDPTRRSTGIPVESTARPSVTTPRRRALYVVIGGGALLALAAAVGWTVFWSEPARPMPKPAVPPPPSASASAPPSGSIPRPPASVPARPPKSAPRR